MVDTSPDFQVYVKPIGSKCNLDCSYCYYLDKPKPEGTNSIVGMPEILLEEYIAQHIEACRQPVIRFSWHGGEPTLLGCEYFQKITAWQTRFLPAGRVIQNGIQTNGTLLDKDWCLFLAKENFVVGLSLDGPRQFHDLHRRSKVGSATFDLALAGYEQLRIHEVHVEILCVVHAGNVGSPLEVYQFFRDIDARYITFLPLVEPELGAPEGVSSRTVPADAWGKFLCFVFDEWLDKDIGRIKIQIIEEATRTAFGLEHSLCLFRETCGDIPILDHQGDLYCCDHYVDQGYRLGNILETPLIKLLSNPMRTSFGEVKRDSLTSECHNCEVLPMCRGECPKNRFITSTDGDVNLNYLCSGYKCFFSHCLPFVESVAKEWRKSKSIS